MNHPALSPLPIDEVLPRVIEILRTNPAVVLCAPPGAGKTTRVPPAILDSGLAENGSILVLQPRRVAARATAARMSAERQTPLGGEIGYRVRFESRVSSQTRIEVMTEGILLRRLLSDSFLDGVAVVIFDEFHERSLASDLALGMVRQVQEIRPELKVVVMSATLAAEPIARYLGGAPIITSMGRMFPVQVRYWPELERRPCDELAADAVRELFREQSTGDCLVFLPGVGEIRNAARNLEPWAAERDVLLCELYGDLPPAQQDAVLSPADRRKVILATNIAETSLTIDGVTAVIDSGLARVNRYDEHLGLDRLELAPISQASADQRAGRAGRTAPGVCLRLWPESAQRNRAPFETPEIHRVDLAGTLLQILCWIEPDLDRFPWFEAPSSVAVTRAQELLISLQAITTDGRQINKLGRRLAELPLHPRLGRLLLAAEEYGVAAWGALAAALLSERDPFQRQSRGRFGPRAVSQLSESDLLDRVHALEAFEEHGHTEFHCGVLNRGGAKTVLRVREQLLKLVRESSRRDVHPETAFLQAVAAAYLDRLAKRREPHGERGVLVGGRGVKLSPESAVRESELFVCVEVDAGSSEALVRQASHVERDWLPPELMRQEVNVFFDAATQKVNARRQTFFRSLLLEERPVGIPNDDAAAEVLVEAAKKAWDQVFPRDHEETVGFINRVRCLKEWLPQADIPGLGDEDLQQLLPDLARGKRSFAELRQGLWLAAIKALFTYPQLQLVETQAPERFQVPSGSRIAIQYAAGQPPILAVRIQELFGLAETPRIANGRVPLLLHLLAPNYRPEQITTDLASFWKNTYPQVRKDLRGRYPKHSWPDDPLQATAESRPRRRPS